MPTRRTAPRRAARFAPTLQPRCAWRRARALAPVPITTRRPAPTPWRDAVSRFERRALLPIALACLACGLIFAAAGAIADSTVASHAGKSAIIFAFAGFRRMAGFGPDAGVDASP